MRRWWAWWTARAIAATSFATPTCRSHAADREPAGGTANSAIRDERLPPSTSFIEK